MATYVSPETMIMINMASALHLCTRGNITALANTVVLFWSHNGRIWISGKKAQSKR